jgi:Cdc6-like AAA superfamily ATPase
MITSKDLLDVKLLEHPFIRYADTRFFYPGLSEQRKVLEVAYDFIADQKDPSKNLGVIAGPSGGGKSILAMKLAQTQFRFEGQGELLGLYMNTNALTEPRHFLMAIVDLLGLRGSRSNADRIDSILDYLKNASEQLLLVLDGPPVDLEYMDQLLSWSIENNKKIKTLIFLQDLNKTTSNIGSLNQYLGLYFPFRNASYTEIAAMLFARMQAAGHPNPLDLLPETKLYEIAESSRNSLSEALRLASIALEDAISAQKGSPMLKKLPLFGK